MRHSDPFDTASDDEDAFRAQALQAVRDGMVESHPDFDGKTCIDCADDIPAERLSWGRIRCTDCADIKERKTNGRFLKGY